MLYYFANFLLYIYFIEENMKIHLVRSKINDTDICLANSAITHTIFKNKKYFSHLTLREPNVNIISGNTKLIEGSRKACHAPSQRSTRGNRRVSLNGSQFLEIQPRTHKTL